MKIIFHGLLRQLHTDEGKEVIGRDGCHSVAPQSMHLSNNLAKLGHETQIVDFAHSEEDIRDIKADAILIDDIPQHLLLTRRYGFEKLKKYEFYLSHRGITEAINMRWVTEQSDIIGFTCEIARELWKNLNGGNCFTASYGFPAEWRYPPIQPNPYKAGKKILLFAGIVYSPWNLEILNRVSKAFPDVEIHIIGSAVEHKDCFFKITGEPPAALKQFIYPQKNIIWHGPMAHGTFTHYLYYADLGLNFMKKVVTVVNCKVWDYLGMGLPTISMPQGQPIDYLIEEAKCGIITDESGYIEAIEKGLNTKFDREGAREWMVENESYYALAKRWDKKIKELE